MAGGILDFLQQPDAQLGIGLLAAAGPTTDPNRTGFGQRLQGAMQTVDAQKQQDVKMKLLQSQMDENNSQVQARQIQAQRDAQIQALVQDRLKGGGAQGGYGAGMSSPAAPSLAAGVNPMFMGNTMSAGMPQPGGMPQSGQMPQGIAQGTGQSASSFPLSLNDITALSGLGFKGADNLFNLYKYATDGVKREAGNYYKDPITGATSYMPKLDNGMSLDGRGNVVEAPGYGRANAGIKGAETQAVEAAKYPYTVGADRSRQLTQAQLDTQPVIGADGNTYYVPRSQIAGIQGGGPSSVSVGAAGSPGGAASPFMAARNPITQQSAISLNDNFIKSTYQPALDAGGRAADLQASIQAIRNVGMDTGWGTETKAQAASMLEGLGIAPGNAKMFASNAQKFQSVAMDRLLTVLAAQNGPQTEGDSTRAQQTFVKLGNTPEANAFVLDFAQAKANMDQRRAQYYGQALPIAQKSGDLTRIDREWRKVQGSIWADPVLQRWSK